MENCHAKTWIEFLSASLDLSSRAPTPMSGRALTPRPRNAPPRRWMRVADERRLPFGVKAPNRHHAKGHCRDRIRQG